jgi:hypothetical protein
MKELLIQTAKKTGIVDADVLAKFLEEDSAGRRIDEVLLACPNFTEEQVLRLFASAMGSEFFSEIPAKQVPPEFMPRNTPKFGVPSRPRSWMIRAARIGVGRCWMNWFYPPRAKTCRY